MLHLSGPKEQIKILVETMLGGYTGDYCVVQASDTSLEKLSQYNRYDLVILTGNSDLTDEQLDSLGSDGPTIVRITGDKDELCEDQRWL